MKALQLTAYGDPKNVIKLVEQPEFGPLAADEWIIDMEAVPVSPTDQYIIAGIYGELPPLPHGLVCEGVGRVSAVGSCVTHVKVGDRVIAPMLQNTTWSTRIKTNETWQRALPEGDLGQMAQVGMNPFTAFLILTEFKTLKAGDWVISSREALHRAAGTLCRHNSRGRRCFDRFHRGTSDFVSPHDRNLDFRRLSPTDPLHWNRSRHIDCVLYSRRNPSLWTYVIRKSKSVLASSLSLGRFRSVHTNSSFAT
ncbi:hypothetical protein HDG33_004284 [Paraburkholderia sp. Cpub6]|nr:alcohol dehydrogenase catalytic domain-containing protein [Paraburkholderia sp. Cpub6]MBB5460619.1 hypothetical protein [Paraburkholderia sp. Cpub6]